MIKFNSKTILIFSDPAGGNVISSLIHNLLSDDKKLNVDFKVFSDFNGKMDIQYEKYVTRITNDYHIINHEINKFQPKQIFATTSTNKFEYHWLSLAKEKKINSRSFVDHWTKIRERFNFKGEEIFPDTIYLINKKALLLAIKQGLPPDILKIEENPYYEKIKNFRPLYSRISFCSKLNIKPEKKIILFISDDIKKSSLSKDLGFDEFSVLKDIINTLISLKESKHLDLKAYFLLIKIHPNAELNKFQNHLIYFKKLNINFSIIRDFDPLTINYYSDYVLGMFSNMVIESHLMNKKLLRIQTGIKINDPLGFDQLNDICIKKLEDLDVSLIKLLKN